jgi:hypothetical protein
MSKRLQVLFDDDEYRDIQRTARENRMTVAEWVRQTLRKDRLGHHRAVETKLKAVADAAGHCFPTADIDVMLDEIERGYVAE